MAMSIDVAEWRETLAINTAINGYAAGLLLDEIERLRAAANNVLWSWDEEHDPSIVDHMEALRALLPPITPPEGFDTE